MTCDHERWYYLDADVLSASTVVTISRAKRRAETLTEDCRTIADWCHAPERYGFHCHAPTINGVPLCHRPRCAP